jgi:hypothetical protein
MIKVFFKWDEICSSVIFNNGISKDAEEYPRFYIFKFDDFNPKIKF